MKVIDRLDVYIKTKGLSDRKVCLDCNLANGTLHQARVRNTDLGKKSMEKILSTYRDLNRVWLLTGEGEMLINNAGDILINNVKNNNHGAVGKYAHSTVDTTIDGVLSGKAELEKELRIQIAELKEALENEKAHSKFLQQMIENLYSMGMANGELILKPNKKA